MSIKKIFAPLLLLCLMAVSTVQAQKLFSRDASVNFDATAKGSPEDITAKNTSGSVVVDLETGKIQASVLIKGFLFERALMQEHFNENYMESTKFPKATYNGTISKDDVKKFSTEGTHSITVKGSMTLHGVTKPLDTTITLVVKGGEASASGKFALKMADFGIDIPGVVQDKVAKEAKVELSAKLKKLG